MTGRRIIVGAGGFGREVRELLHRVPGLELVGFVADRSPPTVPPLGAPYLGTLDVAVQAPVLIAIGYPALRAEVAERLDELGAELAPPLVHPRAETGRDVHLGVGSIVTAGVVATTNIGGGRCVTLHPGALLGHDVTMGDYVAVMPGAAISGNVHLGDRVFVGTNAAILQGVRVGDDATIGAGAVVTRDVQPRTTVVGVPAGARPPA